MKTTLNETITIFSCCNNNYVPYLAVWINSINKHLSDAYNYEIIIAEFDISETMKQKILSMRLRTNLSVIFQKVENKQILGRIEKWKFGRWSKELYISVLAPYIFKQYDKIIYMDCDVINCCDVSELYSVDLEDNFVAVSRLLGRCCRKDNGFLTKQVLAWEQDNTIAQLSEYFNKGVMLMNLKALRQTYSLDYLLDLIEENKFPLYDQDCINFLCKGRTMYVEAGWNWYPRAANEFQNAMRLCPAQFRPYFEEGVHNLRNIHYTTPVKPWLEPFGGYAEAAALFWENAVDTPFYDDIIEKMRQYQDNKAILAKCENNTMRDLEKGIGNPTLLLYGLGERGRACVASKKYDIRAIIDADPRKQGTYCDIPVILPQALDGIDKDKTIIIVSPIRYDEIVHDLYERGFRNIFLLSNKCVVGEDEEKIVRARAVLEDEKSRAVFTEIVLKRMKYMYDKSVKCLDIYEGNMYLYNDFITQDYYEDVDFDTVNKTLAQGNSYIGNQRYDFYAFGGTDIQMNMQKVMDKLEKPALFFVQINEWGADLWEIPLFLNTALPNHKLYVRHHGSNLYGTILYAIPSLDL